MKKTFKCLAILFSSVMAFSCSSNEEIFGTEELSNTERRIAVIAEDFTPTAGTRTAYTERTDGTGYSFSWTEGDDMGIIPQNGTQIQFTIGNGAGTNTAVFDGGNWTLKPNKSYAAYYPLQHDFDLNKKAIPVSYLGQTQDGNGDTRHLAQYDYMASAFTKVDAKGNVSLKLKHLGSLMQLKLNMPKADTYNKVEIVSDGAKFINKGTFDITSDNPTIKVTDASNSFRIDLKDVSTTSDNEELKINFMLAPADYSLSQFSVTIYGNNSEYTTTFYGDNLVKGGAYSNGSNIGDSEIPYITFKSEGAQTLTMSKAVETLEYSVNGGEWKELGTNIVTFGGNNGNLRLRGSNGYGTALNSKEYSTVIFGSEASVECSGDIRTLAEYQNYSTEDTSNDRFCRLFSGCTSLTSAPELPAEKLASWCYNFLFYGCSTLTSVPELPAGTLTSNCYSYMFSGCTSLTTAPELPAETLDYWCYHYMFRGCTSLTSAPELPATTLAHGCYCSMFYECSSLTSAPELPATTLAEMCYYNMFYGCTSLNYIKMMAIDIQGTLQSTDNWVYNVSSTGTFVKSKDATWDYTGPSAVPEGWTIKYMDENGNEVAPIPYITFSATEAQTLTMSSPVDQLEYSVNDSEWQLLNTETIPFGGDKGDLRLRGSNGYGTYSSTSSTISFGTNAKVACSGDIRTLADYTNYRTEDTSDDRFRRLFYNCENLVSAPELPAETLASSCYHNMFYGCSSLKSAPKLPAKTVDKNCYRQMFYGCSSLTTAPELTAETLAQYCYREMFYGCSSLTTAPELPAETLAPNCYEKMFYDCTSLTSAPKKLPAKILEVECYSEMFQNCTSLSRAPEILATTLGDYCFWHMFYNCANLNYIKMMAIDISAYNCFVSWIYNVSATGTFVKNRAAEWEDSGVVPNRWTVEYADE